VKVFNLCGAGIPACRWLRASALGVLLTASCGYHVSGKGDLLPKNLHTIAVPAFQNVTSHYRLNDTLPEALSRELMARTRYKVVPDVKDADAILRGTVVNYFSFPAVFDPANGRASGLQVSVTMQVSLIERSTGKELFSRRAFEMRQTYEFSPSTAPQAYFDESEPALARLSRDAARYVVSALLESF
jgi:hypothetical protein